MEHLSIILVTLVAIEHVYILIMEMFLWTKPRTLKFFGITKEEALISKPLAANMGLYNGFLSAGLIWGICHSDPTFGTQIMMFFLVCVLCAAIFGGLTAKRSILFVQGFPALAALSSIIIL
jgi:putative membrane protein